MGAKTRMEMPRAEQLDVWFTYHQPTEETAPKYKAIAAAVQGLRDAVYEARQMPHEPGTRAPEEAFKLVTDAARAFVETIDSVCPPCADATAAVRCVRLCRNAANDLLCGQTAQVYHDLFMLNLHQARYQANSAIACGGV